MEVGPGAEVWPLICAASRPPPRMMMEMIWQLAAAVRGKRGLGELQPISSPARTYQLRGGAALQCEPPTNDGSAKQTKAVHFVG